MCLYVYVGVGVGGVVRVCARACVCVSVCVCKCAHMGDFRPKCYRFQDAIVATGKSALLSNVNLDEPPC